MAAPSHSPRHPQAEIFPSPQWSGCQGVNDAGRQPPEPAWPETLKSTRPEPPRPSPQALSRSGGTPRPGEGPTGKKGSRRDTPPQAGKTQVPPGKRWGGIDWYPVTLIGKAEAQADGLSIIIRKTEEAERRRRKERKREKKTGVTGNIKRGHSDLPHIPQEDDGEGHANIQIPRRSEHGHKQSWWSSPPPPPPRNHPRKKEK